MTMDNTYYHPRITGAKEWKSMDDNPSTWDYSRIRLETASLLLKWAITKDASYLGMMNLFGLDRMSYQPEDWTPEMMEDMRKLHGPYGKVVYQMIKAKYHDNR
jgi:hypothetical protein